MPYVIRPSGDPDLTKASLHPETGVPQTISALAAGSYDVGWIAWSPVLVNVTGAALASPSIVGTLPPVALPIKSGTKDISAMPLFAGSGLTFALRSAPTSVSVAATTGVIRVDTDQHSTATRLDFIVVATNAAGEATAPVSVDLLAGSRLAISVGSDALRYMNDSELGAALDDMATIGCASLRFDLDWSLVQAAGPTSFDWTEPDRVINAATSRGIGVLPILNFTPQWARSVPASRTCPPTNLADYARFCTAAVNRYGAAKNIRYWEVWNEPNLDNFWKPQPDPDRYAAMLDAAYAAIKTADPLASVVSAGLASVPTTDAQSPIRYMAVDEFLNRMYDRKPRFDIMGFHPYSWPLLPSNTAPWNGWNLMTGKVRSIMQARGDAAKPVWITEFGAPTNATGGGVSEDAQAQMMDEAVKFASGYSWAGPLYWYSYMDRGTNVADTEDWFGLVRRDRSQKKAYALFKTLAAAPAPASFSSQMSFDASATATVSATASQVTEWRAGGSTALSFRSSASPNVTYGTRKIGAGPAIDFTGTGFTSAAIPQMAGSAWSASVDFNYGAKPWSLFLVFVVDDATGTNGVITHIGDGGSSTGPDTILQVSRRADQLRIACNGTANVLPATLVSYGALTTLLITWSGTQARYSVNGAAAMPLGVGANAVSQPTWLLGATLATPDSNRLDGAIAAVLADQSVIDAARHGSLRSLATSRWG